MEGLNSLYWKKNPVNPFRIITISTLHNTVISLNKNISTILLNDIARAYQINPFSVTTTKCDFCQQEKIQSLDDDECYVWWGQEQPSVALKN